LIPASLGKERVGVGSNRNVVNAPVVVGEIIDDEAVILNLQTGLYFNTAGSGAEIWAGLEQGANLDALASRLTRRFALSHDAAREAVSAFLETLRHYALVRTEDGPGEAAAVAQTGGGTEPFVPPVLGTHSELDDLLRLDPIHDVDQMGWPIANRDA
jgi:hypothetical protein